MARSSDHVLVGRLAEIRRYPVKSMAGETLASAELAWHGLSGDRRYAFIRPGLERSGFPWLTIRERADLVHHRARLADPTHPDRTRVIVDTPSGASFDVTDPRLAHALGDGVRVIKQDRGVFDSMVVSLITAQTVASLGRLVGRPLDMRRFRPNLVVEAEPGAEDFPEDAWVGRELSIGDARVRLDQRDRRCVLVNVDPETAQRDPAVLRAIARARDANLGVYGSTVRPGRLAVGDPVWLCA